MMQDHPHIDRLRELVNKPTRWFEEGKPIRMSLIDEDLRYEGLISFAADGFIYLTPAGLDLVFDFGGTP